MKPDEFAQSSEQALLTSRIVGTILAADSWIRLVPCERSIHALSIRFQPSCKEAKMKVKAWFPYDCMHWHSASSIVDDYSWVKSFVYLKPFSPSMITNESAVGRRLMETMQAFGLTFIATITSYINTKDISITMINFAQYGKIWIKSRLQYILE